tara:strand:- start:55 stop:618 length:564 start_codon:yes stop_codon:yes gene_type:complete
LVSYSTSDLKPGLKILLDSQPCEILEEDFVKPGKGQAFSKVKYRNLLTDKVGEKTCKVGESMQSAEVHELNMQYLYSDKEGWIFMNLETYEQVLIPEQVIGPRKDWLVEEDLCKVLFWDGSPISLTLPIFVNLQISKTDPGFKGDSVSAGSKPATLSTGAVIKVPLFLSEGDTVTVDTRSGEYHGRK